MQKTKRSFSLGRRWVWPKESEFRSLPWGHTCLPLTLDVAQMGTSSHLSKEDSPILIFCQRPMPLMTISFPAAWEQKDPERTHRFYSCYSSEQVWNWPRITGQNVKYSLLRGGITLARIVWFKMNWKAQEVSLWSDGRSKKSLFFWPCVEGHLWVRLNRALKPSNTCWFPQRGSAWLPSVHVHSFCWKTFPLWDWH